MVIKGKTIRWFNIPENIKKLSPRRKQELKNTNYKINPFYFRHERKQVRIEIHRSVRHNNKILLRKGLEVQREYPTNGWLTY